MPQAISVVVAGRDRAEAFQVAFRFNYVTVSFLSGFAVPLDRFGNVFFDAQKAFFIAFGKKILRSGMVVFRGFADPVHRLFPVRFDPAAYSYVEVHQPAVCCFVFAVLCFLLAVKTDVRPGRLSKLLSSLSTSTVGIYVFHYSVVTLSFALAGTFWWHDWSRKGFFLFAIVDSVALFFLSWLLDLARKRAWEASKKALSGAFGDGPA